MVWLERARDCCSSRFLEVREERTEAEYIELNQRCVFQFCILFT